MDLFRIRLLIEKKVFASNSADPITFSRELLYSLDFLFSPLWKPDMMKKCSEKSFLAPGSVFNYIILSFLASGDMMICLPKKTFLRSRN